METQKPPIKPIAYTYGVYLALLSILGVVVMYIANLERNWISSVISLIITVIIYHYGIGEYKKRNSNLLSIKDALKVGLAMAVIGGIIAAIYVYIHYSFIQPEFVDNLREQSMLQMTEKNPDLSGDALDSAVKMMNFFTSPFFISTMVIISSLFFGLIISLIVGAIKKRD